MILFPQIIIKIIRVFNGEYLMGFIPFEVISREKKLKLKICGPLRHCEKIEFQVIQMIVSKELLLYSESRKQ
jgi:hypothetical protein